MEKVLPKQVVIFSDLDYILTTASGTSNNIINILANGPEPET
jgi:hypothetical protein